MTALYWREPLWALLGLLPLLWLGIERWQALRLRRRYAEPALWPWALAETRPAGTRWRRAALLLAWLLLGLAAAGPRLPAWLPPGQDQGQATLMVILDLSRSMDATDAWPSRRRLAVRALTELLPHLKGSRVGMVVTAGHAHLLWPPSGDRHTLAQLSARLGDLRPPSRGSALAEAVALVQQQLAGVDGTRQLLLLSDGDLDAPGWQALQAAMRRAAAAGITPLIAGSGTAGGAALSGTDGGWLQRDGQPVLSRLAEAPLRSLASALGGVYLTLPEQQPGAALLARLPAELTRLALDADAPVQWHELFPWLLLPAALLWLLAGLRLAPLAAPAGIAASLLYLLGLSLALPARADPLAVAYQALAAGDPARARMLFAEQPGYAARMGGGSACHRLEDWSCARRAFSRAVLLAPDDTARARAVYNLAHSLFQSGDYRGAAALFDDALRYRPDYPAARHNRDFAAALAEEVARLAGGPQDARPGRGPASRTAGDTPLPASASRRLEPTVPPGDRTATPQRRALLARGLDYTRLAEARHADASAPWGRGQETTTTTGAADIILWQTLLERAEGLPASPARPLTLPGVRPW